MIGTVLHDRWRILSALGRGGMGEVFLAEHIAHGRKEALKILAPSLANDPRFVSRFRREARAVNRLHHPNIIAVYDFGQLPDQRFFLSMEYVDGESVLGHLHRDEVFAIPRALQVLAQLAYAAHHAHSRGVVHRDLKPGNLILVGADDTLKVLDFGIAKIVAADHAESVALSSDKLVYGTPRYMSPERVRGIGNDARSDLYAIGCIAFELLIGVTPFVGTPNEVIAAHLTQVPEAPSSVRPSLGIPPELDAIVLRCLAKQPDERFQSAADLYAALTKLPRFPAPKPQARRRFVPTPRRPGTLDPPASDETSAKSVRGTLRYIAESLVDYGIDDARLVTGIAQLRDHEMSLARLEAAQDALEHEAAALRETTEDRETSLRFALAELELAAKTPALSVQINDLRTRLAATAVESERLRTAEQGIAQITQIHTESLTKLKGAYDALESVVDEVLGARTGDPVINPLAHRLAFARSRRTSG